MARYQQTILDPLDMETAMKILEVMMICQMPGERKLQRICRDYQGILAERGMLDNTDEDSQEESFSSDEWDKEDEDY